MKTSNTPAPGAADAREPVAVPGARTGLLARAAFIVTFTAGCLISVTAGWSSPLRVVLGLGFLLFCPGLALAEVLEVRDLPQRLTIATATSLALDTLLSLSLIYAGAFSVTTAVAILAAVTMVAFAGALVRGGIHSHRDQGVQPVR
jgi:uncharacterized membrane protein